MFFKSHVDFSKMRQWKKLAAEQMAEIEAKLPTVHKVRVMTILRDLIVATPVDTGRLRAAWLPYFTREGSDVGQKALLQTSLASAKFGSTPSVDATAVLEGEKQGDIVTDRPGYTVVSNNVEYGEYVERRFGFVQLVTMITEERHKKLMQLWINKVVKAFNEGKSIKAVEPEVPPA